MKIAVIVSLAVIVMGTGCASGVADTDEATLSNEAALTDNEARIDKSEHGAMVDLRTPETTGFSHVWTGAELERHASPINDERDVKFRKLP